MRTNQQTMKKAGSLEYIWCVIRPTFVMIPSHTNTCQKQQQNKHQHVWTILRCPFTSQKFIPTQRVASKVLAVFVLLFQQG
jgi:hypothetical protein